MKNTGTIIAAVLLVTAGIVGTPALAASKPKPATVQVDLKIACAKGGSLSFDGINGTHAEARKAAGCPVYSPTPIIPRWGKAKNYFAYVW